MQPSSKNSGEHPLPAPPGRPRKLTAEQVETLREIALAHPQATVEELRRMLAQRCGVQICAMTLYRYLPRAGIGRQRSPKPVQSPGGLEPAANAHAQPAAKAPPSRSGYNNRHRDPGDAVRYPSSLTDAEWALVADLFEKKGPGKPPLYPRRLLVDACCYVVRSGCPWRLLPKDFPPWQDVYATFRRWTDKGLFEAMHDRLRTMWRQRMGREDAPTAGVLDSQSIKTSAQGGPKGYDAGKKVKGRKRHLVVDVLGLLLAVLILPAHIQDRDAAAPLVARAVDKYPTLKKLLADSSYAGECEKSIKAQYGIEVEVIRRPRKAGAWTDATGPPPTALSAPFPILPRRWVVERTHAWIERPRRLSKDYDRRPDVSAAWVWLAETRILLRRLTEPEAA